MATNIVLKRLFQFIKKKATCVAPILPINDAMRLIKNNQIENEFVPESNGDA